jgi:uncharacterized membrane protein
MTQNYIKERLETQMFSIKNTIKNIGMTAAALALVAGIAGAPSASASSLSSSRLSSTPIVQQQEGKINVVVYTSRPTVTPQQATVAVLDRNGEVVSKALVNAGGQITFKVNTGAYKVQVSADGFGTETREVKVSPDATSNVKVVLYSASDR